MPVLLLEEKHNVYLKKLFVRQSSVSLFDHLFLMQNKDLASVFVKSMIQIIHFSDIRIILQRVEIVCLAFIYALRVL